jgi:threonine/homoserine/homoserine lactone efflux protein
MPTDITWLLGVLTLGLLSPGPDFLLVVRNSIGTSRGRAFGTVAGIAAGLAAQVLVISLGLAAAPPAVLRAVQFAGAAFLAWIGVRSLLAKAGNAAEATGPHHVDAGARGGFVEGLLCNLTNPKAFLFFVSLFAQVLRPETPPLWRVALPVTIVVHGALAWSLVSLAVQSPPVSRQLSRAQLWLPRAFGVALIALAVWVAWQAWPR